MILAEAWLSLVWSPAPLLLGKVNYVAIYAQTVVKYVQN